MPALADPSAPGGDWGGANAGQGPIRSPSRWNDLRKRTLSALLLAPTALLCIWLGAEAWTALMAVAAVGLGVEWISLCGGNPKRLPGLLVPAWLLVAGAVGVLDHEGWALLLLLAGAVSTWWYVERRHSARPVEYPAAARWPAAAGILYVGIPLTSLLWLRGSGEAGRAEVLFLVLVVWASDIGGYVVGRLVGGPKLVPTISPGKTWSGAVGGLLTAMLVGELAAQAMAPSGFGRAAAAACVLGVAAQAGDLLESWIKRQFGVKDSGWLIPGHGGLLDRLDGLMAAAPAAVVIALLNAGAMGRGEVLWN